MGRPKAFDPDEALQAGVELFWRQGYAATTTDDLARAMGIGRQSFYDTFGDKRRCYLEALRRYSHAEIGRQVAAMRGLAPLDAYVLCSVAVDLKITEVVDRPNWVVAAYLPQSILV